MISEIKKYKTGSYHGGILLQAAFTRSFSQYHRPEKDSSKRIRGSSGRVDIKHKRLQYSVITGGFNRFIKQLNCVSFLVPVLILA